MFTVTRGWYLLHYSMDRNRNGHCIKPIVQVTRHSLTCKVTHSTSGTMTARYKY